MADGQKTEQPTHRRLKKAREEGQFPTARVFVSAMQFVAFVSLIHFWGEAWILDIRNSMARLFEHALDPKMGSQQVVALALDLVQHTLIGLAVLGATLLGVTIAMQFVVTRMGISLKKLTPDIHRLSPLEKLKQLPRQN